MTIAISIKVNDGVVLAADSASTIIGQDNKGRLGVINVYNNANKIFNLCYDEPVGVITWGSGSIGQESISTLVKDFRNQLDLNDGYEIKNVAKEFTKFIWEKYDEEFKEWPEKPNLGFMVVGYSDNRPLAEEWKIDIQQGICEKPKQVRKENEIGITWNGETEAINRIYLGYGGNLIRILESEKIDPEIIERIISKHHDSYLSMLLPAMPIQDAIDLAKFLVETTTQFSRFVPGAPTVGGPIEIAAITKHEGFKWVNRKHYYNKDLNPIW